MASYHFIESAGAGVSSRLRLEGEITIESAGEFKQALLQALESDGVVVDFSAATAVDLSALQLLCAAHRAATAQGKNLAVDGREEPLALVVEESGFRRQCSCLLSPEKTNCIWLTRCAG